MLYINNNNWGILDSVKLTIVEKLFCSIHSKGRDRNKENNVC